MALDFTDEQIKELSSDVLTGPDLVVSANDAVADAEQQKQDFLEKDERNTVFTDNMINIVDQFHKELKELDGTVKTLYDESNIDTGGQLIISAHYPDQWPFFYPKVLDSNTGLPTSVTTDLIEPDAVDEVQEEIDYLVNGFSDGSGTGSSDGSVSGGVIPLDDPPVGFSVGNRIVLLVGGGVTGASFGVITAIDTITPPPPPVGPTPPDTYAIQYDVEFTAGSLPTGTSFQNFHPGFTNAQREASTNNLYQIYRQDEIDSDVTAWKDILLRIEGYLNANDSTTDKAEVDSEKAEVANALTVIATWEGQPDIGVGVGRFGDTQLAQLISELSDRETRIPDRVIEVNNSLGTLTQDLTTAGKGEFSGDGRYFDYFEALNARIHQANGSLKNFYQMDNAITFLEQDRDNVIAEVERLDGILQIKLLIEDPDGTDTIKLEHVSDMLIGQEIKFMDNEKPVLNYSIVNIIPEERQLVLDGSLPTNYKLTKQVRVVRVL